jgi:hypothetical protein
MNDDPSTSSLSAIGIFLPDHREFISLSAIGAMRQYTPDLSSPAGRTLAQPIWLQLLLSCQKACNYSRTIFGWRNGQGELAVAKRLHIAYLECS